MILHDFLDILVLQNIVSRVWIIGRLHQIWLSPPDDVTLCSIDESSLPLEMGLSSYISVELCAHIFLHHWSREIKLLHQ